MLGYLLSVIYIFFDAGGGQKLQDEIKSRLGNPTYRSTNFRFKVSLKP